MENNEFDMESFRETAIAKLQAGDGLLGEGGAVRFPFNATTI